jgi:hypothetical protein
LSAGADAIDLALSWRWGEAGSEAERLRSIRDPEELLLSSSSLNCSRVVFCVDACRETGEAAPCEYKEPELHEQEHEREHVEHVD